MSNKILLIVFSIVYIFGLLIGCLFDNIKYYFIFSGIFSIISLWLIYFLTQSKPIENNVKPEHVPIPQPEIELQKEEPKLEITTEIYSGEIISEEEFYKMKEESKTWFGKTNTRLNDSIQDLQNIFEHVKES